MRVLLIAYEFPPSPSPQSLRWAYLVRELHNLGHQVCVLAPDIPAYGGGLPALPDQVIVHRTFAGLIAELPGWLARRRNNAKSVSNQAVVLDRVQQASRPVTLNWKGRLFERIKQGMVYFLFPDIRAEWNVWARRELAKLVPHYRPDVVIASHEPASTLMLGLLAKSYGIPLVADLGDPVLASYTPKRWKARAFKLESAICAYADHVTVTCMQAFELLSHRHGLGEDRCTVVSQGFDIRGEADTEMGGQRTESRPLTLLYTGSFYSFRRANELLSAIIANAGATLEIASASVPQEILDVAKRHPERIRLLGFLHHDEVLQRQKTADVLINIGNADSVQIPGKLYEYLGSGKPILQISCAERDPGRQLVESLRRGWVCQDDEAAIARQLGALVRAHAQGNLHADLDLSVSSVVQFSWRAQARKMNAVLNHVAGHHPLGPAD